MLNFTQSKREREIEERKGKRASEMKRVVTYILVIFKNLIQFKFLQVNQKVLNTFFEKE